MATTYLILSNRILRELNEVEMTSTTFSSSRGIQTAVKDFINKAVHDIYNEGAEIPLLHSSTTQILQAGDGEYTFPSDMRTVDFESFFLRPTELITNGEFASTINSWTTIAGSGSASHSSTGNGRALLNDYAIYQAISTVKNKTYKIQVRAYDSESTGQAFKVQVGTAAEGTQNLSTTLTVANFGESKVLDATFTATATTSYVTINNTSTATNMLVDYVRVSRSDITPVKLAHRDYQRKLKLLKTDYGTHASYMRTDVVTESIIANIGTRTA